jgi:hypothetical protein
VRRSDGLVPGPNSSILRCFGPPTSVTLVIHNVDGSRDDRGKAPRCQVRPRFHANRWLHGCRSVCLRL